jgi:hypothetical protein
MQKHSLNTEEPRYMKVKRADDFIWKIWVIDS